MKLGYLILRNMKLFFKDKGLVLSSLITPMILIVLYVTFLRNVYVDSFHSAVEANNIAVSDKVVNGFVYGWLFSSLLAVSGVTVAFCSNLLMVQDKVTGAIHDMNIAPVKKTTMAIAYYIASMAVTLIICYIEMFVGFLIMAGTGWFLSVGDVLLIMLNVFLIVNFGTALSSIIHHFLTTQGQMSAVGTIVSSVYGFICGAYMPISQFGTTLQRLLSFLPGTYGTVAMRYSFERGVLKDLRTNQGFPDDVVDKIASNFDIKMKFFNTEVSNLASVLVLGISVLVFLGVYVVLNIRRKKELF